MQKQAPQMKEMTRLDTQASIMLGPQLNMDNPPNIFNEFNSWCRCRLSRSGEVLQGNASIGCWPFESTETTEPEVGDFIEHIAEIIGIPWISGKFYFT